jgi:hypothetical protein
VTSARDLIVFIGSFQRDKNLHDEDAVSYSANNLQEYFIDTIAKNFELKCLLVTPKKNFFRGGSLFYKGHLNKFNHTEHNIAYVNFQPFKLVGVNLIIASMILLLYVKERGKLKVISFNSSIYYALPIILSKLLRIYEVLILADLPSQKRINIDFFKLNTLVLLGDYAKKIITFNKNSIELFFSNKNKILEIDFPFKAINRSSEVNNELNLHKDTEIISGRVILSYSGSLSKRYSIDKLIQLAESLPDIITLNLYGKLEDDLIVNMINKSDNVIYHGFIENKNLINELSRSDFLIVIYDDSTDIEIRYPNRLVEYMFAGKPILVNCKESFPLWMRDFINCIDIEDTEVFFNSLSALIDIDSYFKLLNKAQEAKKYVESESYLNNIEEKIVLFLSN